MAFQERKGRKWRVTTLPDGAARGVTKRRARQMGVKPAPRRKREVSS